jgi:hypothetical protein
MLMTFSRVAILSVVLVLSDVATRADDLADFSLAADRVISQDAAAIGALRGGNMDQALAEIGALRESWRVLQLRFAGKPPAALKGNPLFADLFTGVSAHLVGADMMLKAGRPGAAVQSLEAIRDDLTALRTTPGR